MKKSNNQKEITIKKELCNDKSKNNYYAKINLNALQDALIDLKTEGSIKLWLYMAKNQDNYTFALSSIDAIKWGIGSKGMYDRAVKDLKDKGYLVEVDPEKNKYLFYEKARLDKRADVYDITKV